MSGGKSTADGEHIKKLTERAKELDCLYAIDEILADGGPCIGPVLQKTAESLPSAWQYPEVCGVRIRYADETYQSAGFVESKWFLKVPIVVQEIPAGELMVSYAEERPDVGGGPFLKEERRLLQTIARRLGAFLWQSKLKAVGAGGAAQALEATAAAASEWKIALRLLGRVDRRLLGLVSRKMLNHLCLKGVPEAQDLLENFGEGTRRGRCVGDFNQPQRKAPLDSFLALGNEIFRVAEASLAPSDINVLLQRWIRQDRSGFFVKVACNTHSSLADISEAARRYREMEADGIDLSTATRTGVLVALLQRMFTDQLDYINTAARYVELEDVLDLFPRVISVPSSLGKLGGKSSGLFLAKRIIKKKAGNFEELAAIKTPKTWYITSDCVYHFRNHNNLEEIFEQKYKHISEIRLEYPHIIELFKNAQFPPEMVKGLSAALDDFGEVPLIVRSSSLLEDRAGAAFSGKYKSLFLANQGPKNRRLEALMDAVAEVYASTFGPDPMEYRAERGLINFNEEMAILIQEVVGKRVGDYFFPAYAGVAFSRCEMRWSPRLKKEDGLLRLVPGLGTRAVDRVSEDYPMLAAPGQPDLRVNSSEEELRRYSTRKIDLINLREGRLETRDLLEVIRQCGTNYPGFGKVMSVSKDGRLQRAGLLADVEKEDLIAAFDGLLGDGIFIKRIRSILGVLEEALHSPVDIEFASDGEDLYLLQCRAQNLGRPDEMPDIPIDVPAEDIIFTANRFVANAKVENIAYLVYVDAAAYAALPDLDSLVGVAQAIGRLNQVLPRRRFILIGPGRWGSRGDVRLGVPVTYSDINNAAMLIEVACQRGSYIPDLSFGTHFFQDLVEAGIRYLPLYPDDQGIQFNWEFLQQSVNALERFTPEFQFLAPVVRVIDVPALTAGRVFSVFMNGEQDKAMGFIGAP